MELTFELVDPLVRHSQPAAGLSPGDRIATTKPCPRLEYDHTVTALARDRLTEAENCLGLDSDPETG